MSRTRVHVAGIEAFFCDNCQHEKCYQESSLHSGYGKILFSSPCMFSGVYSMDYLCHFVCLCLLHTDLTYLPSTFSLSSLVRTQHWDEYSV